MARRDPIEERIAALAELRRETRVDVVCKQLQAALVQKRSGLLVSRAAKMTAELATEFDLTPLVSALEGAFRRLLVDALKRDKGCLGKIEICRALVEMGQPSSEVFLAGIEWIQMEPVWGGSVDTASQLRGWSAHGLIRMRHADALLRVAPLLADGERPARLAAADALGDSGQLGAEAVLRLKAVSGDEEPEVTGECFQSLLRLDAQRSRPFVVGFLHHREPAVVEAAALALGESRLPEVVEPLRECAEATVDADIQGSLYLALALTRRGAALDILLQTVEDGALGRARRALAALALHRHDDGVRRRLQAAVEERDDGELQRIWRQDLAV